MTVRYVALAVCVAALSAYGQTASAGAEVWSDGRGVDGANSVWSSSSLPEAPEMSVEGMGSSGGIQRAPNTRMRLHMRPFSALAVMTKAGFEGLGVDVATPLAAKINLRVSLSYTNVSPTISYDGVAVDGNIKLRTASVSVDLFPYHSTFHISPGVTLFNQNHATVIVDVPAGQTFTIEDTDYTSDPADPIKGNFYFHMGRKIGPSLTVGWGNMLRADSHWSIPVDFGVEYVGTPVFALYVTGSACDPYDGCFPIPSDASTQANLQQEQATINKDIAPLRFFPLLSVGLSYRFGANRDRSNWR